MMVMVDQDREVEAASNGVDLRDLFAAHAPVDWSMALQGASLVVATPENRCRVWAVMGRLRYEYADAMLEARK